MFRSTMEKNRYFVFQMMDLYTFNFDYVGSRTTGNGGGDYLIAGPDWKGQTPKGIAKVIRSETQLVNVVGRTQLFNPDDAAISQRLPAGSTGEAAIFTEHVKVAHIIRKVLLRQIAITNYVNPF